MTNQPFLNVRAKLARARTLTEELRRTIAAYDGAILRAEPGPGGLTLTVRVLKPVPEMADILGDAVHNLRTALDYLAVAVVEQNGGNTKSVYFPFAECEADLPEQIKRRKFHRASAEAVDLLLSIRPYRGGDDTLRALHDLDILDKHNDLIPVYAAAVQQMPLHLPNGGLFARNRFNLVDGGRAVFLGGAGGVAIPDIPMGLLARFPNNSPFGGHEVVPALAGLAELVSGIVDAFEALALRERAELGRSEMGG